jgi:uncharacterized SAM-binding protein YcdF (DUF218 family)
MGGLAGRFNGRGRRVTAVVILVLLVVFFALSARLFVFPDTGMPARVDAIVVLGGGGGRLDLGVQLAGDDRAPYLVLSKGLPWITPGLCTKHVGATTVICFQPDPDTTQGEAEGAARLAKRYGWRSMVLVTTRDQVWRAHLRFQRCYAGTIYGVDAPVPWYRWPYAITYQWGGTVKAELFQRGC